MNLMVKNYQEEEYTTIANKRVLYLLIGIREEGYSEEGMLEQRAEREAKTEPDCLISREPPLPCSAFR